MCDAEATILRKGRKYKNEGKIIHSILRAIQYASAAALNFRWLPEQCQISDFGHTGNWFKTYVGKQWDQCPHLHWYFPFRIWGTCIVELVGHYKFPLMRWVLEYGVQDDENSEINVRLEWIGATWFEDTWWADGPFSVLRAIYIFHNICFHSRFKVSG